MSKGKINNVKLCNVCGEPINEHDVSYVRTNKATLKVNGDLSFNKKSTYEHLSCNSAWIDDYE